MVKLDTGDLPLRLGDNEVLRVQEKGDDMPDLLSLPTDLASPAIATGHRRRRGTRPPAGPTAATSGARAVDPARPLGPKARVIVARRRTRSPVHIARTDHIDCRFDSQDGQLHLELKATPQGLVVEWSKTGPEGVRLIQCLLLVSIDDLHQWIEAAALSHKDPGLHQRLCRRGEELFDGTGH